MARHGIRFAAAAAVVVVVAATDVGISKIGTTPNEESRDTKRLQWNLLFKQQTSLSSHEHDLATSMRSTQTT